MARAQRRQLWNGLLGAITATALAVAVNLATELKTSWWAWVAVGVTTAAGYLVGHRLFPASGGDSQRPTNLVIDERSTRRGWVGKELNSTVIQGAVLEIVDRWPDGRESTFRTSDREVAQSLIEIRSFEVTRELEREP
ncbi:MAG: hypothetical protein V9G12_21530 [Microthrixaceae bacterium]